MPDQDLTPKLAEKIAARQVREKEADPYGFWSMTERQLVEWLGAGNAEPGSVRYDQARLVLEQKRREWDHANQKASEFNRWMEQATAPVAPAPPQTNGKFFGLLALVVALGGAVGLVLPATVSRIVVAAVVVLVVAALLVPAVRLPVSRWLDRTFD